MWGFEAFWQGIKIQGFQGGEYSTMANLMLTEILIDFQSFAKIRLSALEEKVFKLISKKTIY